MLDASPLPPKSIAADAESKTARDVELQTEGGPVKVILQRRREERIPVKIRGLLYHGGNYQTTIIEDISVHGAGLTGAMGIVPGDNIAVQLLNGRELSGEVKWWLADRCGIVFHRPLDPADPLLNRQRTGDV